jgi:hypothetical protein
MIYGKGFIAKAFKKYKKNNNFIFFASGVSNSLEIKLHRYNKEINLLNKVISYKNLSLSIHLVIIVVIFPLNQFC